MFQEMLAHLEPVAGAEPDLLQRKLGNIWAKTQFQDLEEELRAASWQEPETGPEGRSQPKARGFSLGAFAKSAAVHRTTVYRWRKANPWFNELLRSLKARVRRQTLMAELGNPENLGKRKGRFDEGKRL